MSENKSNEKQELRDLILKTSKSILLSKGKEGLSIRKIAAEISYSPATIYLYFKDKDSILHHLMEQGFDLLGEYMAEGFDDKDPVARIHKIGRAYIKFAIDHKDWYDLMFNSSSPMKHLQKAKEDWDKGVQMFDFLIKTCQEYIDQSDRKGLKADMLALHMWAAVHGLVNLWGTSRLEIVESKDHIELMYQTLESVSTAIFSDFR